MRAVVIDTGERLLLDAIGLLVDGVAYWLTVDGQLIDERRMLRWNP